MTFSFGAVWSRFFKLIGENIGPLLALCVLFMLLPQLAWQLGMYQLYHVTNMDWTRHIGTMGAAGIGTGVAGGFVVWIFSLIGLCSVTEVAILRAVGKPVKLGEVIGHAIGNILPVFAISLIVGIITGFASLLFLIPGIMFALASCVAIPAYVGEKGRGLWGSVQRSFELTKGHRWLLLLIYIVAFIALWIVAMLFEAPMLGIIMGGAMRGDTNVTPGLGPIVIMVLGSALVTVMSYVFIAAVYVTLRESKEKLSPDQTASIF